MTYKLLSQYDRNADGIIEQAEISDAQSERFSTADMNADGYIDRYEFEELRAVVEAQDGPRRGSFMRTRDPFSQMDANQDGLISKTEFQSNGDKFLERADLNGDGMITQEELQEMSARFRRFR